MFKDDYRRELDKLTVSEKFRQDTISLMQERQEQLSRENKTAKTIKFNPKPYRKIAASAAVALLAVGTMAYTFGLPDFLIGPDSTENEAAIATHNVEDGDISANYTTDKSPAASQKENMRVYTIDDAVEIASADFKAAEKITFFTESSGGMGFEGLMYYDISELNTKNAFDENIVLNTLPVYKFSSMSSEDIRYEFNRIMDNTNMSKDDINSISYEWVEWGVKGQKAVITKTITTETDEKPTDSAQLYNIKVDMESGYMEFWPELSTINLHIYDDLPEDNAITGQYAVSNYTDLFGNNLDSYVYGDYNIYGEQHFFPHYVFQVSDDYAQNAFNNSAGVTLVWHHDELWQSENDKGENIYFQYTADCTYTNSEELPAISWQQGLKMLYDGEYYSSVPYTIDETSVVSKIELIYKEPPRSYQTMTNEGWAVPFYKFYVRLPDETATEKGMLKTYGVYYVCAIHPDYIELTDEYIQFNGAY